MKKLTGNVFPRQAGDGFYHPELRHSISLVMNNVTKIEFFSVAKLYDLAFSARYDL